MLTYVVVLWCDHNLYPQGHSIASLSLLSPRVHVLVLYGSADRVTVCLSVCRWRINIYNKYSMTFSGTSSALLLEQLSTWHVHVHRNNSGGSCTEGGGGVLHGARHTLARRTNWGEGRVLCYGRTDISSYRYHCYIHVTTAQSKTEVQNEQTTFR